MLPFHPSRVARDRLGSVSRTRDREERTMILISGPFFVAQNENHEIVDDDAISYIMDNVVAGSDTTIAAVTACL